MNFQTYTTKYFPSKVVHLRVWDNMPAIISACGKVQRLKQKDGWAWTHNIDDVTCEECKKGRAK